MRKNHSMLLRFMASAALAAVLLTSCAGGAATYEKQMELGRKYLTEMNYAEAIAAFTEAIKLNPDDIEAYMARAEAYAALEKYDEATSDYTAVIEKTGDQPYLQATAYIGRAGVGESTDSLTDAESDYTAALAQLAKDTDAQDADAVLTLKKDVLAKHAAVCITLALLEKAADDYDALEALGENVTAKRNELADLVQDTTDVDADAENNLTPDTAETTDAETPDAPETKDAEDTAEKTETKDTPDSKETAADSKEEKSASSKGEAASSKEEQPASSKQETQPAQQTGQKETYQAVEWYYDTTASVTYQIGTNTVWATEKSSVPEREEYDWRVWDYTYTLSQPVLSVEHPHTGSTLFHVPEGTVVTRQVKIYGEDWLWTSETKADGTAKYVPEPYSETYNDIQWGTISSADKLLYLEEMDNTQDTASMTVKKGKIYGVADADESGPSNIGYPEIGFVAD